MFNWSLTSSSITDVVGLIVKLDVLPVIFVPGIMGSNLRQLKGGKSVWRLDAGPNNKPTGLIAAMWSASAGERQALLHPDRTQVDPGGAVAGGVGFNDEKALRARGWGTVAQTSYGGFLRWLEETLNPQENNPALWHDYYQDQATISAPPKPGDRPKLFPGIRMGVKGQPFSAEMPFDPVLTDDLLMRSKFWMPVHAVGYNWLASNAEAAEGELKPAIEDIMRGYNKNQFSCKQVILVTHSMGGLVARACAKLPGMEKSIAGIVHGVMPATGAAVAYRRCKVGMRDEGFGVEGYVGAKVIGRTGREVTSVFAQAPGALQLLPSKDYGAGWLGVIQGPSTQQKWPTADPYEEIYKVRDKWWGLVNEAWLTPKDGVPIKWREFTESVDSARDFHEHIAGQYHPSTYVFYGADKAQPSFERISWRMKPGNAPDSKQAPRMAQVLGLSSGQVRLDGATPEFVPGPQVHEMVATPYGVSAVDYQSSYWELHCEKHDAIGDGTVPESSGRSPRERGSGNVKQQFKLMGFAHELAFNDTTARNATLYAITKLAGRAKIGP